MMAQRIDWCWLQEITMARVLPIVIPIRVAFPVRTKIPRGGDGGGGPAVPGPWMVPE